MFLSSELMEDSHSSIGYRMCPILSIYYDIQSHMKTRSICELLNEMIERKKIAGKFRLLSSLCL